MVDPIFKYPLDLFGTNPNNRVVDEPHTLGAVKNRIFASNYGPFYGDSVQVVDAATGRILNQDGNEDYILLHYYREASEASSKAVYAAVFVTNPEVSDQVLFTAQLVGGEYSYTAYAIQEAIAALQDDDRKISWGDLIGLPAEFPAAPHLHDAYDLYGFKHLVAANYEIAQAIRDQGYAQYEILIQNMRDHEKHVEDLITGLSTLFKEAADELSSIE